MFESLGQDLRFAVRSLTRRPLFLLVSVFSISIGIGANTAIFSAVSRFVLRPPQGIPNAERVVEVGRGRDNSRFDSFSYPDFLDLRGEAGPLQALAGFDMRALTVSQGTEGERVFGLLVSANYFDVLGIRPLMGRTFVPEEDEGADEHPVVILAHSFWQEALGGDPEIVGSTLYVSRQPYTVVGVTPEGFRGHVALAEADIFVPFMQYPSLNEGRNLFDQRGSSWFNVLGLLRPGASAEEANAAVSVVFSRLADEYPETNAGRTGAVRPFRALPAVLRGPVALFLTALLTLVGLLLLLTCSNVAGMFLARASSRRREIAIRLSMGSSRRRLIRHLLTESLLVFMLGGRAGS